MTKTTHHTKTGKTLTDRDLDAIGAEVTATEYDIVALKSRRRGRPLLGIAPAELSPSASIRSCAPRSKPAPKQTTPGEHSAPTSLRSDPRHDELISDGYRLAIDNANCHHLVDQHACAAIAEEQITKLRMMCSGFRPSGWRAIRWHPTSGAPDGSSAGPLRAQTAGAVGAVPR